MRILTITLALLAWTTGLGAEAPGKILFEDRFEGEGIQSSWSWLREDPKGWSLSKEQLRIRTNGNLWESKNTQQNILLREIPGEVTDGFIVEVTVNGQLKLDQVYEHGGLIWYLDDDNWVTLTQLNHVEDKTQKIMLVHETRGDGRAGDSKAVPFHDPQVALRLVVEDRRFTAYYRKSTREDWQALGFIMFPKFNRPPRIGLVAGQGPETSEHWVTFDDFRIERMP